MTTENPSLSSQNGGSVNAGHSDAAGGGNGEPPQIELRPGGASSGGFQRFARPPGMTSPNTGAHSSPHPPGMAAPSSNPPPSSSSSHPPPPGFSSSSGNSTNFDDLADAFAGSFVVNNTPNDTNRPHPRFAQFKMKSGSLPQEERRKKILAYQKQRRDDLVNHARCLAMGEFDDEEPAGAGADQHEEEEDMEIEHRYRPRRSYKHQLMLSEWLVEVPEDLSSQWILVLCPEGRRNFVVASNGITKVFSKNGKQVNKFPSNIPGGSRSQNRRNSYSILDCIFSEKEKIFYILDMMCWDGFQYYDCDTEFRMSWVQQKFIENKDQLMESSRNNRYKFVPLPIYQCTTESIHSALNTKMPFQDKVDGLLFYHKQVHYMPGYTPLVGWLKGYMVPELLNIQVGEEILSQMPSDYSGMKVMLKKTYERVDRLKKQNAEQEGEKENMEMA